MTQVTLIAGKRLSSAGAIPTIPLTHRIRAVRKQSTFLEALTQGCGASLKGVSVARAGHQFKYK